MGTILVVDDEPAIRQMLVFTLTGDDHECIEAGDTQAAQNAIDAHAPDLVLLDWMLPGISGVEFARRLKRDPKTRNLPVIMLSAKGEELDKVQALDVGADDYITKPFSTAELLARIRAVLRRSNAESADTETIKRGGICLDAATHRVNVDEKHIQLSATEFRLLHYFMANSERVHARGQLLDAVWGNTTYVEERTVDVHIRRLRKLLEPLRRDHLIQTVRGVGYRFSENQQ